MKAFTDQSTASREEKARRFLRALSTETDGRYFYPDGFPRQDDIATDAKAALEVLEALLAPPNAKNQGDSGGFIAGGSPGLPG